MKHKNICCIILLISILLLSSFVTSLFADAKKLYQERIYEPVVLRGEILSAFFDVPIDEIYLYAYYDSTKSYHSIPFQIDEMEFAEDPFKPGKEDAWQDFYFAQDDGLFDFRDELVFMVRDMGDKAPDNAWIENEEARKHDRLEIKLIDPNDRSICAYVYLFRSATISDEIPAPYGFSFDPQNQVAKTKFYSLRLGQANGLIEDVIIPPPFGTGIDFFDTQKLRFVGVFDLGILTIPIGKNGGQAANERDNLHVYHEDDVDNYHLYSTPKPIVRLIREVRQTIRFGTFVMHQTAFYVKTKFYPFSGTISGGADLDPETLKKEFQLEEDVYIQLDLLRQSWDFNRAAEGMTFFNRYNENVVIDGIPDQVNKAVATPVAEWTLTTGEQGSMFSYIQFEDSSWQQVGLYFHDNKTGGQVDDTFIEGGDTGDSVSYGDQGILLQNHGAANLSLKLDFTAYFLPGNLIRSDGERLAYWVENPVLKSSRALSFSTGINQKNSEHLPEEFQLFQNYPNPFNSFTTISFALPNSERIRMRIIDIQGRTVAMLADRIFEPGIHNLEWNGIDEQNHPVASGVYFCEARAKEFCSVRKLIVLR
ncbi:MAG TPA: T9SS type A sorting domain-containing protein [bacterium]